MKYAVIYYSETGNTELIADKIFETIDSQEKICVNLNEESDIPQADVYFIGFPIYRQSCNLIIMELLEKIEKGKLVLFATCGLSATDNYKQKLEETLTLWISEEVEYFGMFLCQGETKEQQKIDFYQSNPEYVNEMREMLNRGDGHPNSEDFDEVADYVKNIQKVLG